MLFNSYEFIFIYLPIVFLGFFFIGRYSSHYAALWLAVASLFFYGWWNPKFVSLLLVSIVFNFFAGYFIGDEKFTAKSKLIFITSIAANLILLGIFKYTNFFIVSANSLGANWSTLDIILPLGISFFTFTQIAYLVDVRRGVAHEYNFVHYLLFVTWFPHLIAGPVLHHKQMMPQFASSSIYKPNNESIAVGLTLFSLGLFKKVVLADQFALFANPVFNAVAQTGSHPMFFEAWIGVLAYALQLYFDFSGYSDMAIGLSRMFNVKLPLNFNSPYKAANIIDFWRCWHMTLSKFLRDYLYVPLGGNRKGPVRRHLNLMVTMLLGGLWHGAGWTFVLWGGLHGLYLVLNHAWRKLTGTTGIAKNRLTHAVSVVITFIAIIIAWVPFRAASTSATMTILKGMAGLNGISLPVALIGWFGKYLSAYVQFKGLTPINNFNGIEVWTWLPVGLLIVWSMPNTQQWLSRYSPAWDNVSISGFRSLWRPSRSLGIIMGLIFAVSVLYFKKNSQFLYFQF